MDVQWFAGPLIEALAAKPWCCVVLPVRVPILLIRAAPVGQTCVVARVGGRSRKPQRIMEVLMLADKDTSRR